MGYRPPRMKVRGLLSSVVAAAELDQELTAKLGLEVNRPPCPEPSRLDDWFLGAGRSSQPRSAPVPFFLEVHEELTKSWTAPFTARSCSSPSSVLTTLDGKAVRGYMDIPQVERAVAVHLCPQNTATWRNRLRLPSCLALAAKAYSAVGQAASALHAMAILQVHQAKALKQMHEGSSDPRLMQELHSATDFFRPEGAPASGRRCPLWWSISGSTSQAGLSGDTVEGFAQQFLAVQKQTEAIQHILLDAPPAIATPRARLIAVGLQSCSAPRWINT